MSQDETSEKVKVDDKSDGDGTDKKEFETPPTRKVVGLHIYPHPVFIAAINRFCKKLRLAHPDFQNRKKVSQSRAFEFIVEQVLGESDEELKAFIELRNAQRNLYHDQKEEIKTVRKVNTLTIRRGYEDE